MPQGARHDRNGPDFAGLWRGDAQQRPQVDPAYLLGYQAPVVVRPHVLVSVLRQPPAEFVVAEDLDNRLAQGFAGVRRHEKRVRPVLHAAPELAYRTHALPTAM